MLPASCRQIKLDKLIASAGKLPPVPYEAGRV
jgi:hypothetical protein